MTEHEHTSKAFVAYLLATTVLSGALVMVVEVLGSRVIGPFFGVSLFVWTSLIAVTLIALAFGYAVGGSLSDRLGHPKYLFTIILVAGLFVAAVPLVKAPILKWCLPLGLRWGAFASTTLLFGPSLFLLGCVSPYLVKILAKEMHNIGRVVGGLYALSTFGSIVGTIIAGFFLIAYLGVDTIFILTGLLLMAIGAGYFVLFARDFRALGLLVLPLFLFQSDHTPSKLMPDGTRVEVIYSEDSYYGALKVIDYSFKDKHTRELVIDGLVQGGIDVNNGLSIYEYPYLLQFIPYMMNPKGKDSLVIGLGAGVVPTWYEKRGVRTDVVDIDPSVVEIARNHFGFKISGEAIVSDARYFLSSNQRHYDHIILDVFSGDITPGHLLSQEALQLTKARLNEGGILAVNLVGSLKRETFMTASVIKTLESVFDQVDIYPTFQVNEGDGAGNMVLIAYQGERRVINPSLARQFRVHPWIGNGIQQMLSSPFHFPDEEHAIILTDDYNPIDFYDGWLREKVRKRIIESTDLDVLIGS